jgi:ring-1,2-phenylacetyl-CoA epoxidase subunit PaaC
MFEQATLSMPEDGWMASGGKAGRHGEAFGYLLAEMQYLQRRYPGVRW